MADDPYRYFRVEAKQLLEQLTKGVLAIEKGAAVAETLPALFRYAHTLKGAARVVRQSAIADLAHAIEDALGALRGATEVGADRVDPVLRALDAISRHVAALDAPKEKAVEPVRSISTPRQEPLAAGAVVDNAPPGDDREGRRDALLEAITAAGALAASTRAESDGLERTARLVDLLAGHITAPKPFADRDASMRAIVDDLRAKLQDASRAMARQLDQLGRELDRAREEAEQLRLVRPRSLLVALERTARDAARDLEKRVAFEGRGGDLLVEAEALARVEPALHQMVRNAVAHGVEDEAARVAAGKPPAGSVRVDVFRRGGRVVFRCEDDGRGIDLAGVRRAAVRAGVAEESTRDLDARGLLELLLRGGITTSTSVTQVSGRGVGLDVVRDAARALGASVHVETRAGLGTVLELVVSAALSSIEALLVRSSGSVVAIPLDAVVRSDSAAGEAAIHDGRALTITPLHRWLGEEAKPRASGSSTLVVVRSGDATAAIGVDRIVGTATLVVRPLPRLAPLAPVVAGASFDSVGDALLVLDPEILTVAPRAPTVDPARVPPPVLVIDDSLTTRMLEQSILESAGFTVDVAASAEEGLGKARAKRYGVILVDVEMPGMDGFTFLEHVRRDAALARVPAILVTSRASPEDRRRGFEAGADAFVAKGEFDQRELLAEVRRLGGYE